jgi:hypothetical protein
VHVVVVNKQLMVFFTSHCVHGSAPATPNGSFSKILGVCKKLP